MTLALPLLAQPHAKWATVWAASAYVPYPSGNASAQPDLRFAFPSPSAHDQTFRLIVQPDAWGRQARFRLSNAFGTQAVTIDGVFVGLHLSGGAIVHGTNQPIHFSGKPSVTVPAGE